MEISWEHADIKLPTAEFARFRQTITEQELAHQTSLFEHSQDFWRGLTAKQKSDREAYTAAFEAYELENTVMVALTPFPLPGRETHIVSSLPTGLCDFVDARRGISYAAAPARVMKESVDFVNNRTTTFTTDNGDATLTFVKEISTVQWNVPENSGAVDKAHTSRLGAAFFGRLISVPWTRNTGGVVFGGEQHRRDAGDYGGLHSLIHDGYGPVGAAQAPFITDGYIMADGTVVSPDEFPAALKAARHRAKHEQRRAKAELKALNAIAAREMDPRAADRPTFGVPAVRLAPTDASHRGRLSAGNGARSGEWTSKDQTGPEVRLEAVAAHV